MAKATIVFADNDIDFLNTRSEFLGNAGYTVLKALTLQEAERLLEEAQVHLAILDIRMVDDDDERDVSGLNLARDLAYRPVPKIILTGFPTTEAVREALRVQTDGLQPAVDFLEKKEGPEAMIQAVERAFAERVRINWDLHIHWDQRERLSFLHLASLLQPDLSNDILVHRAGELEDLVCRLFYDYQQIRIGRLLWHDGWRFCLSVLAQLSQGATDPRILVCGERRWLERELKRMQELAPETVQGTKLGDTAETVHYGAAVHVLLEADIEMVQSLRDLFQSGRERPLKAAFDHLLKEILGAWHQHGHMVEKEHDLMSLYRRWVGLAGTELSRTEVESRVEALIQAVRPLSAVEIERSNGLVTFRFPSQVPLTCPDPVATVHASLEPYDAPVVCKISPGQLTADNVLVDAGRRTWLTDFAYAGQAPQWWDFICLEAVIRFDLSQTSDLLAWLEFEECLVTPVSLYERLQERDVVPNLRTSMVLIERIRRQAGSETSPDPLPYYAGLLAWAVGAMACHDPAVLYTRAERMRGAHLLLASAMLARRLGETFPAPFLEGTLHLDDDGTVWIGDRRIDTLVGQEVGLLRCLYEQVGESVSRRIIVESVFGESYQATDKYQESRINSLVRRLRVKIEPDPDRPRYILTIRGKGYRLETGKEADREAAKSP